MPSLGMKRYGQVGVPAVAWTLLVCLSMVPFTIAQSVLHVLTAIHVQIDRHSTLARRLTIVLPRYVTTYLAYPQIQFLLGPPLRTVRLWGWMQNVNLTTVKLGNYPHDEKYMDRSGSEQTPYLIFLGPPPTVGQKVLFYMPGGGYVNPITPNTLSFFHWLQSQLEGVRVVILLYRLRPSQPFPAPLVDALLGLRYLTMTLDILPQDLQLAGDSAGGHLVLQVLAVLARKVHIPQLPLVPALQDDESGLLGGVLLISPWTCLASDDSWDDRYDTLKKTTFQSWGSEYLADTKAYLGSSQSIKTNGPHVSPSDLNAFMDPHYASSTYFSFLSKLTTRVYVTSGGRECMALSGAHRQLIERLCGREEHNLQEVNGHGVEVRSVTRSDGVHGDPMLDFVFWFRGWRSYLWGDGMAGDVANWLKAGL